RGFRYEVSPGRCRRPSERQGPDSQRSRQGRNRHVPDALMAARPWRILSTSVIARNVVAESFASLRGRRLQAMLSSFGIATGIAAVVLLVSIVSGMHHFMIEQIGAVGGNTIQVSTSTQRSTRDPRGFQVTLRVDDLAAVMEGV